MMRIPKISIITVCKNDLELLKKTVESVTSLTYENKEYLVIDGNSTDGTLDYLNSHRNCIDIFISEPDKGIYDAMNKGTKLASGDFVIFMNAGDIFTSENVIEKLFPKYQESCVVYGSIIRKGKVKPAERPRNCHRMFFCHQSSFTRREILLEYPFDIRHCLSADFKQYKILFKAGKTFCHTDVPVADIDLTGISHTQRSRGIWDNITVVRELDSLAYRIKFLPRLYFVYLILKIRRK